MAFRICAHFLNPTFAGSRITGLTRSIFPALLTLDVIIVTRYCGRMIVSFASADTERIYLEQPPKKTRLPQELLRKALDKLRMVDAAETIYDFYNPPSNHFEALRGDRKGQYS